MQIRNFITFVLAMQLATCTVVVLNIPVARQVIGFLCLLLVPGIIILRLLKLTNLELSETVLLSVGLSIAFLMFIGALINEIGPSIGISKPLSLTPLMIVINTAILLLCLLSGLVNREAFNTTFSEISKSSLTIMPFVLLPFLSVIGALFVNAFRNNLVLLLMIITISALIVLATLYEKLLPPRFYPLALLMIAITLLFHASLISNYVYGNDIHVEYRVFKLTENNSYWNSTVSEYTKMNAMESITILPTIYLTILNMDATWVMKIIYPLFFSFTSLGLYHLYQNQTSEKVAFLSTFFFMANSTFFYEMPQLNRQMVSELFYVLLFLISFSKKMNPLSKKICFIFFSFALIVSHYGIAYVFMFIIVLTWVVSSFLKDKARSITTGLVVLFLTMLFSWYIYTSASGAFNEVVSVGNSVYRSIFTDFFSPQSRGETVLRGLGLESPPSFLHLISRAFAYATEFFIVIGFITLITKQKSTFDKEYIMIASLNMALLAMCIILPQFAETLNMTRFYHIELFFLSPLCILGGEAFFKFILGLTNKSYVFSFVLIILIPFFLFQTELIYEVTGAPSWSVPLSWYRMDWRTFRSTGLIHERDVFGAKWFSENIDVELTQTYSDIHSKHMVLTSYGMIDRYRIEALSNTTNILPNGAVYLSPINVINGIILKFPGLGWNLTEFSSVLNNMNKIYSNGGSEIYR